ncbi:hypothetical protein BDQ17DRAFT_1357719 [Cyathus striatus]|nr:hypothetical protein BDQ17DRAFT_1357719 [Cyathus striatus]
MGNTVDAETVLKTFISHEPNAHYTFDSERDSPQSIICRETGNVRDCITLQMDSKRMFEAMQEQGFFCKLPIDPARTYIECKPMPR